MKVKVESYKIVCDCCGETFHNACDFVCYCEDSDGSQILEDALNADWVEAGGKHYCPDCYSIDEDSNIVTKDGHKYDGDTYEEIKKD